MILFLDFDGVLHPKGSRDMRHMPLLADLLRQFPWVRIVVSSTWREAYGIKALRNFFPEDIRPMVIGATTVLDEHQTPWPRSEEIAAWLVAHTPISGNPQEWLAVDDEPGLFSHDDRKQRLILCNPSAGIQLDQITKIREAIHAQGV